jgi:hypothetical protein
MGDRAERLERRFERPMLVVAALVIPALILEEAHVPQSWKTLASALNWLIWFAFLGELIASLHHLSRLPLFRACAGCACCASRGCFD